MWRIDYNYNCFSPKLWKKIWSPKCPPKIRLFWWKVCHNALAAKENLFSRRCTSIPLCSLFALEYFRCTWVREVWSIIPLPWLLRSASVWFVEVLNSSSCIEYLIVLGILLFLMVFLPVTFGLCSMGESGFGPSGDKNQNILNHI